MLRVNLVSVFMVDEIRRIVCEALIPYLQQNKDQLSRDVQKKIKQQESKLKRQLTGGKVGEEDTGKVTQENDQTE